MTEKLGLFTVQSWLALAPEQRDRLDWLVRDQGGDLADTLTRIVADRPLGELPVASERLGGERLPVRIYLAAEQREALERHVAASKTPLPELLTLIVAEFLEGVPEPPARVAAPDVPDHRERRARQAELARLRARRDEAGASAPAWLDAYIAELEAELA
jgi:hypothetical protein